MKLEKISEITSLLPTQDAQTKYCLLRSCLSLPKIMFTLRTVNTLSQPHFLAEFDRLTREALTLTGIGTFLKVNLQQCLRVRAEDGGGHQ